MYAGLSYWISPVDNVKGHLNWFETLYILIHVNQKVYTSIKKKITPQNIIVSWRKIITERKTTQNWNIFLNMNKQRCEDKGQNTDISKNHIYFDQQV